MASRVVYFLAEPPEDSHIQFPGMIPSQARTITAESGVRGLYRGFWPTLLRDVPEIAIQFTLYERCGHPVNIQPTLSLVASARRTGDSLLYVARASYPVIISEGPL